MHEYTLAGSHYTMGRENAARLQQAGYPLPQPPTAEQLHFAYACQAVVGEHTPWLLDEIRGVADAGVFDPEAATVLPLTLYADSGCSVIAVSGRHTRAGKPLFGRNYDFFTSFGKQNSLYRTRAAGRLAHIGCSDHWVGRHDGLNAAGLAIGHSGPPTRIRRPGFIFTLAIRAVLDTCRTVGEAAAFLERIPHLQNSAFLIADATGAIAAVDVSPAEVRTTLFSDGFGFLTNQYASEAMQAHAPNEVWEEAAARAENVRRWYQTHSDIGLADVQRVLADPGAGVCACADADSEADDPAVTLWSWTAALGDPVLYLAKGTPHETPYASVAL